MSKLRHLSDAELLRELEWVRHKSPVIRELWYRLEKARHVDGVHDVSCPVCQASLHAEYCDYDGTIELEARE